MQSVAGRELPPKKYMYLHSFLKSHTQFRWNLMTTFITRDVPKFVHCIKKNRGHNIGSLVHFADSVPCWLPPRCHYSTRWALRDMAPIFYFCNLFIPLLIASKSYPAAQFVRSHLSSPCSSINLYLIERKRTSKLENLIGEGLYG